MDGRDLTVEIKSPAGIENNIPYRIDGNILIMTYYGYEQKRTGEYSITLWEKKGKPGQNVVDVIRAFELVRTSQEENDFVGGDLQIESVDLGTENFDILTEGGYRAINIDTLQAEALGDSVNIKGKTYSNESFTITLPKANLDSAGVMSADDKHTLQEHGNRIAQINTTLDEHTESINARITTDRISDGAVTIDKLEHSIQSLLTNISKNASFAGIATPTTNPGTPEGPVFYIASTAGNYSNFGGIEISQNELAILYKLSNSWSSYIIQLGTEVIFDVSARFPTGGTGGTDNYTIETAIAAVPNDLQLNVRYLTFKTSDTERELWQFNSIRTASISYFKDVKKWYKMRPSMFHELEWNKVANQTRVKVPIYERTSGMIIHYTDDNNNSVYELYVGENNKDGEAYYNNFIQLYTSSQVDSKVSYNTAPIFAKGDFANAIKELYIDKYEDGAIYQITRLIVGDNYQNGLIWINKQGDSTDYSVVNKKNLGGIDGGIVEVKSADGLFHAYLIIDWSKITYGYNEKITMVISNAAKVMENSPTIYAKLNLTSIATQAAIGAGLKNKLYNEAENIVFEDLTEQAGDENYTYNNIGLVHKATKQESFNVIKVGLLKLSTQAVTSGSLIVKKGASISKDGGTIIKQVDNFSNSELPQSGLYEVQLGQDVTLEEGEYLWIYYTGNNVTIRVWKSNNEKGTRIGMYFQGSINTHKYCTAFTLLQSKGDIVDIQERLSSVEETLGIGGDDTKLNSPLVTLPEDLYVITGREQTFYFNEFVYGIESNVDNTLLNYNIGSRISPSGLGNKCVATKEGFTIYTKTSGEYTITVSIYDYYNNLLTQKICTLHSVDAPVVSERSILMLGDSWTDINNANKGYTPYLNAALKEMGITAKFIGTRDAGTSGLKHEGIGGYAWTTFASSPKTVRFKFFVDSMPSISGDDIYSNNGSTYKLYEKGSNYLTLSRQSGSTEPSGNTLIRTSGTGDETITFTSWTIGGGNPLWNTVTNKLDFTHYRQDLCGLSTPLDICNIQLGVNDSFGNLKTTKAEWGDTLQAASQIIDAILADSPNCKIIVNLVGMDCPSPTGWSSLNGLVDSKRGYQLNCYYLRTYINDLIKSREDYNTNVFIGQSVLGINRWYGYGYVDNRYRYFKVDTDSMSSEDLEKLKNFDFQQRSVWVYTDVEHKEFQAHYYDARGYLVCKEQQGFASWDKHEQEFVNVKSVPQNTVPEAGNLTKGGGSASVDFPVVPYTACYIENNNSKEHWFMNATHPYDLGYRQMAYCLAHQIAILL